jgi:hypothetical protein
MALTQIVDKLDVMDRSREAAIATITEHVDVAVSAGFSSSDGWWRKALWIAVGLIALSNIIGAGVGKLIELLK